MVRYWDGGEERFGMFDGVEDTPPPRAAVTKRTTFAWLRRLWQQRDAARAERDALQAVATAVVEVQQSNLAERDAAREEVTRLEAEAHVTAVRLRNAETQLAAQTERLNGLFALAEPVVSEARASAAAWKQRALRAEATLREIGLAAPKPPDGS